MIFEYFNYLIGLVAYVILNKGDSLNKIKQRVFKKSVKKYSVFLYLS